MMIKKKNYEQTNNDVQVHIVGIDSNTYIQITTDSKTFLKNSNRHNSKKFVGASAYFNYAATANG